MIYRPTGRIVTVAASSGAVVPLDDLKEQSRLAGIDDSDAELTAMERAAVAHIERRIQRLLIERQVTMALPGLPDERTPIELPWGPVADPAGVVVTVDGVALSRTWTRHGEAPAILFPDTDWPAVEDGVYPVGVTYTAGYSTVPPDLVHAVKLLVAHFFEHREAVVAGASVAALPLGVEDLTRPYRVFPL